MSSQFLRCTHHTTRNTQCKLKAQHVYNEQPLCNLHLDVIKSREDCPICFAPLDDPSEEKIQLSQCGHYHHKKCLSMCQQSQCPTCRTPLVPTDNLAIYQKTIFEPLASLLFTHSKEVQGNIVSSISLLFGHSSLRSPSHFSVAEWSLKIVNYSIEYGVPIDALMNIMSMNSAAVIYYNEHQSFEGFDHQPYLRTM